MTHQPDVNLETGPPETQAEGSWDLQGDKRQAEQNARGRHPALVPSVATKSATA